MDYNMNRIYFYCIKYERLNHMIESFKFMPIPKSINIFIDLNSVLSGFYSGITVPNDLSLASGILNLAAHYSRYFRFIDVPVNIHLTLGSYSPKFNLDHIPNYNHVKFTKVSNDTVSQRLINNNLDIVKTMAKYIPHVYFNTTSYENGVLMKEIIDRDKDSANVIITTDQYLYQLVSDNVVIFRPKKTHTKDMSKDLSYYINKINNIDTYCIERKLKIPSQYQFNSGLSNELFTLFILTMGNSLRGVRMGKSRQANSALNLLSSAITNNTIINGYNTVLPNNKKFEELLGPNYYNEFNTLDLKVQHLHFSNSFEKNNVELIDLHDPVTLNEINNRYFAKCPIILDNFYS